MSAKILLAAAASTIFLAAPALAVAATHPMHAQSATAAKTTPAKTASAKTMATKTTAKKVTHRHHSKTARNISTRGDREVSALNALESAGYRQFANLHAKGHEFVATAMKNGKSYDVTVTGADRIEAIRA